MKKYIISGLVVVAFGIYVLLNGQQSTSVASVPATTTRTAGGNNPLSPTTPTSTGAYKNGSYKGNVADAYFGKLQVEAIVAGGKLADVQFLIFPTAPGHTTQVSNMSMSVLKQEAIQSQSANVNIVSGATQTSQAFQQSLGVALALAKN